MPKQMPLIAGAVAILLLIIGAVVFMQMKKSPAQSPEAAMSESPKTEESMTKGTIKSLLGLGKSQTCEITYTDGGRGTIFVADKKMRGDFMMMVAGKQNESHMIQDGDTAYMWSGDQGTKMKIDAAKASPTAAASGTGSQQAADLEKDVDLKCSSWSVDSSKFTPPADVKFTDLSDVMMKMEKTAPQGSSKPSTNSSACDSITDPAAKASCMSAYGQ